MTDLVVPLHKEINGLKARLDALEASANLADRYKGVYNEGDAHRRGDLVTHQGSLWIALQDTVIKPGVSTSWKLVVKRGKDFDDRKFRALTDRIEELEAEVFEAEA